MGTIVKPCDAYIYMLEVRKSLIPKIKELHDSGIFIECDPLFILKNLITNYFVKLYMILFVMLFWNVVGKTYHLSIL